MTAPRLLATLAILVPLGCAGARAPQEGPGASELERIERQLEGFYEPLFYLAEESRLAIEDVMDHLKRDYVFPTDGPLPEDELRFWLFRSENDLMPRNEEMVALIQARKTLAEGDTLPPILNALVEHQRSWRELHRRWKEQGVKYGWRSSSPFPRNLGTVLEREIARLKARHAELLKQTPGAEARHLEKQIRELYGPLVRQNRERALLMEQFQEEFARKNHDPALRLLWNHQAFFPRNEETRRTIRENIHLAEGTGIPAGFLAFVNHWNPWKMERAWREELGEAPPASSKHDFPQDEFAGAAEKTFQELSSRRIHLAAPR
jgi:hypothetical protein